MGVPKYANLVTKDGTVTKVSPTQVELDEVIKIKPGERVPLDGKASLITPKPMIK